MGTDTADRPSIIFPPPLFFSHFWVPAFFYLVMENMKILTLARKCGNHAILFACFKFGTVLHCYRYWGIKDLDGEKF